MTTILPTHGTSPKAQIPEKLEAAPATLGRKVAIAALKALWVLCAVLAAFFAFVSVNLALMGLPTVLGGLLPTGVFTGASIAAREAFQWLEASRA